MCASHTRSGGGTEARVGAVCVFCMCAVETRKNQLQHVLRDMEYHHTGWSWIHTDGSMSLFSQHESAALVYDGISRAPLFELMFLLNEPDLYKVW